MAIALGASCAFAPSVARAHHEAPARSRRAGDVRAVVRLFLLGIVYAPAIAAPLPATLVWGGRVTRGAGR